MKPFFSFCHPHDHQLDETFSTSSSVVCTYRISSYSLYNRSIQIHLRHHQSKNWLSTFIHDMWGGGGGVPERLTIKNALTNHNVLMLQLWYGVFPFYTSPVHRFNQVIFDCLPHNSPDHVLHIHSTQQSKFKYLKYFLSMLSVTIEIDHTSFTYNSNYKETRVITVGNYA